MDEKRVPTLKISPYEDLKVFWDLNSEFWGAAISDEKRVPTLKISPYEDLKVFLDLSSDF